MSVRCSAWAWRLQLDATDKLVLLALADHANDEDYRAWPSLTHLANKCGLSRRGVSYALNRLESGGFITRENRGLQTTIYTLQADSAPDALVNQMHYGTRCTSANGDRGSAPGAPQVVHQVHTETSVEPSRTVNDMSGKPDVTTNNGKSRKNGSEHRHHAVEILDYLNEKAGRHFQHTDTNIRFITARLKGGATAEQCRAVIDQQVRKWADDPKMAEYLRPSTLFNREKFDQYVGLLGVSLPKEQTKTDGAPRPRYVNV